MRILIVDPQPETPALLPMLLGEHGHEVHLARGLDDASSLATQWEIELVLVIEPADDFEIETLSTALRAAGYNGRILQTERLEKGVDTLPPLDPG